jgi:membrane-associated protein
MFDVDAWVRSGGILLVAAIVFAESGLLIGFFLPGDTLLFSAGLLASQGLISIDWLIIATIVAAIAGDNVGYSIGRRTGHRIFRKEDSLLFHKDHLVRAEKFYEAHGGKTVTLARFVPMVRTFAPIVAGVAKMPRQRFMAYNIIGGVLWGGGVTLLGYALGNRLPWLHHYIDLVLLGVVALSIGGSTLHIMREPKTRRIVLSNIRLFFRNIFLNKKID